MRRIQDTGIRRKRQTRNEHCYYNTGVYSRNSTTDSDAEETTVINCKLWTISTLRVSREKKIPSQKVAMATRTQ